MKSTVIKMRLLILVPFLFVGCGDSGQVGPNPLVLKEVVVYTALDREFSEPILEEYERHEGVRVLAKYDSESTKTIGLTNMIIAESSNPRCDLFWNNEILQTIRLKKRGLLASWVPPNAGDYPEAFRDKAKTWYGFAARGRILIVNTKLIPKQADRPTSIYDLVNPKWKGKVGLAKPLFGTTATHATCLFATLGEEKAKQFFLGIKQNEARILSGNKQVAVDVAAGRLFFGLTDTDDAMGEIESGQAVAIVYPDRKDDQMGTLFIPNTLAILKGAPHQQEAEALAVELLKPATEEALAKSASVQIPLNRRVKLRLKVETPQTLNAMKIDFEQASEIWQKSMDFLIREFGSGS
jgi:iron(III) transport system substrate-binding protein